MDIQMSHDDHLHCRLSTILTIDIATSLRRNDIDIPFFTDDFDSDILVVLLAHDVGEFVLSPPSQDLVFENKRDLQVDTVFGDLAVFNDHLLVTKINQKPINNSLGRIG